MDRFDRCNLFELALEQGPAHDGEGDISFRRIAVRKDLDGACNFIDYAEVPPASTIGLHRHASDEEEFYLVLGGEGEMSKDDEVFRVRAGDLIRNRPDGTHSLRNVGSDVLRLFVFELSVVM
jgi:mannose-6-phosphate isomerase-like protein (cupin superfamily)